MNMVTKKSEIWNKLQNGVSKLKKIALNSLEIQN